MNRTTTAAALLVAVSALGLTACTASTDTTNNGGDKQTQQASADWVQVGELSVKTQYGTTMGSIRVTNKSGDSTASLLVTVTLLGKDGSPLTTLDGGFPNTVKDGQTVTVELVGMDPVPNSWGGKYSVDYIS